MLRIALVEDDKSAADLMMAYLKRYSEEKGINYSVDWFDCSLKFLADFKSNYDLVFMDIELPDLNGMELARRIRKTDTDVVLVFVTNYSVFAVNGYEFDVAEFIEKPVSYYNFAMKFKHALLKVTVKSDEVKTEIKTNGATKFIAIKDIYYVEVIRHKLIYHTFGGDIEARQTLKSLEEELTEHGFAKCNNYCLVNLRYVYGVTGYVLSLNTGIGENERTELIISKPRRKSFIGSLNEFLGKSV